jgi:hypothetical protein
MDPGFSVDPRLPVENFLACLWKKTERDRFPQKSALKWYAKKRISTEIGAEMVRKCCSLNAEMVHIADRAYAEMVHNCSFPR